MPLKVLLQTQHGREVIKTSIDEDSYPQIILFKDDAFIFRYTSGKGVDEFATYVHRDIVYLFNKKEEKIDPNILEKNANYETGIYYKNNLYEVYIKTNRSPCEIRNMGGFHSLEEARNELAFWYWIFYKKNVDTTKEMPKIKEENHAS